MKIFLNKGNQIHNFISSSCSGSDFLTSYGSGSTSKKLRFQRFRFHNAAWREAMTRRRAAWKMSSSDQSGFTSRTRAAWDKDGVSVKNSRVSSRTVAHASKWLKNCTVWSWAEFRIRIDLMRMDPVFFSYCESRSRTRSRSLPLIKFLENFFCNFFSYPTVTVSLGTVQIMFLFMKKNVITNFLHIYKNFFKI